ncbi:MAG: sugar-binding transcriptional regulator [Anaerolineaceae bacterium]
MIDLKFLTKIAILYYREGLTHEEISQRLGMSRQTVGRNVERARKEGLVEIRIKSPLLFTAELERTLEKEFNLKEALVVSTAFEGENGVKEALGMAGADFLERRVMSGDTLGISWGSTVLEVGRRLRPVKRKNVTIVQLNGSMDVGRYSTRAEHTVDLVAEAFGGQMVTFSAPMLVDRHEILKSLLSDSRIASVMSTARKANIAIYGVGDVSESSSPYKVGYFDKNILDRAQQDGAVGEICGRFFDSNGRPCSSQLDDRILAVELNDLKQKTLSVAIAGSPNKVEAIYGMLKGQFCNVLITDENTARAIINKSADLS